MLLNINKTALCGLSVLVFGLISCTEDISQKTENPTTWSLQEPVILQTTGTEMKYTDVNQTPGVTYSVDDKIVFADNVSEVELAVSSVCSRDGERHTYSRQTSLQKEMKLIEFMPREVLYSPEAHHLNGVSCSLELTAYYKDGSTHYFPALHLTMNDVSQNDLHLVSKMQKIEAENNQLPRIQIANFGEVFLPRLSSNEGYYLQCETLSAVSGDRDVRTLAEMEVQGDLSKLRPSEVCRLFLMNENTVLAVSPFFTVEFLSMDGLTSNSFTLIVPQGAFRGHIMSGIVTLSQHRVQNGFNEPLYFQIPKTHPVHLRIRVRGFVETDLTDSVFTQIEGGHVVQSNPNYWLVRLGPGQELTISFTLRPHIKCGFPILELTAEFDQAVFIHAMDESFQKVVATWAASPLHFGRIETDYPDMKTPGTYRKVPGYCRAIR